MCSGATAKARHVILDFNMFLEIITFEEKKYGRESIENTITRHKKENLLNEKDL